MKKKFKVLMDDSGYRPTWSVWNLTENGSIEYRWAEFYGPKARWYALEHAKKLSEGV